jgi:hypothetical protein
MKVYFTKLFLVSSSLLFIFLCKNLPLKAQPNFNSQLEQKVKRQQQIFEWLKSQKTVSGNISFPGYVKPSDISCNDIEVKMWEQVYRSPSPPNEPDFGPYPDKGNLLSSTRAENKSENSNICEYTLIFILQSTTNYVLEAFLTKPTKSDISDRTILWGNFDQGEGSKVLNIQIPPRPTFPR